MADFDRVSCAAKLAGEEFSEEAPVAFFSRRFGAEESDGSFESRRIAACGNVALAHQFEERSLVRWPIFGGAIGIAGFGRWRKERLGFVGDPPQTVEKKRDVGKFGEAGELAGAVFADVNHFRDPGVVKEPEEFLGGLAGKADGAERGVHARITSARRLPDQPGRRSVLLEADRHLPAPRS